MDNPAKASPVAAYPVPFIREFQQLPR